MYTYISIVFKYLQSSAGIITPLVEEQWRQRPLRKTARIGDVNVNEVEVQPHKSRTNRVRNDATRQQRMHACVRVRTSALGWDFLVFLDRGPHRARVLLFIFSLIKTECCRGQGPSLPRYPCPPHLATGCQPPPTVRTSSAPGVSSAKSSPNQSKPTSKCRVIVYIFFGSPPSNLPHRDDD